MPTGVPLLLTYGWLLINVAMLWSAYHCVHGTSCLCTLSASAFIEPSLYQLDFFFRNLFMETCFCSFLIVIHTLLQHCLVIPAHAPTVIIIPSLHRHMLTVAHCLYMYSGTSLIWTSKIRTPPYSEYLLWPNAAFACYLFRAHNRYIRLIISTRYLPITDIAVGFNKSSLTATRQRQASF